MHLNNVPKLLKLSMRQNLMDKLSFPRLPSLEELNIEANKVLSFKEFDNLKVLPYNVKEPAFVDFGVCEGESVL